MDMKALVHLWMELPWYWDVPIRERLTQLKRVLASSKVAKEQLNDLKLLPRIKERKCTSVSNVAR